jgi:hypothetical protein
MQQQQQQHLMDVLGQAGGIESLARELGVGRDQATAGAAALIPAILGGFKKRAQSEPAGLENLAGMLGGLGGGGLMDEVLSPRATNVAPGNDILGQIFGSKDVSRTVAVNASARTGLDPAVLKRMLPILAMLVAGYMARSNRGAATGSPQPGGGGVGDVLGGALRGGREGVTPGGAGGLASMLDLDGDGNPLDDILGMAGKFFRR